MVTFNCDKLKALKNLWFGTRTVGFGFINSNEPTEQELINAFQYEDNGKLIKNDYIDYFKGRPIKTNFENFPELNPFLYDRDAGEGTMQKVARSSK